MKKLSVLTMAALLLFAACKKNDDPEQSADCAEVLCLSVGHILAVRLVDEQGKNLVYGPDASIPKESISLYYGDKPLLWRSSADSATSSAFIGAYLEATYAQSSVRTPGNDFTLDLTLKISTASGIKTYLLHILNHRNCCGAMVTGIQINKEGVVYKANNTNGFAPIDLPIKI
ncbi:hypothetical protein [Chitinophaga sp. sic0106]|uniref:hypothetical protein n=1 Tax=Chitinophaga sp. sic0106 TaxID=2854785 RepID=UPI001C48E6FD|nr:hypothetical protein [Chitinophaga sp. sic0106]MBV7533704.1 hypothetical protein [Chitinophaga sp. sic0106]